MSVAHEFRLGYHIDLTIAVVTGSERMIDFDSAVGELLGLLIS